MSLSNETSAKELTAVSSPTSLNPMSSPPRVPIATNKNKVAYVSPGVVDSEGFLAPPPASTLLIRRTRTNSSGSSTYVIASTTSTSPTTAEGNQTITDEVGNEGPLKPLDQQDSSSRVSSNSSSLDTDNDHACPSPLASLETHTNSIPSTENPLSISMDQSIEPRLKIPKLHLIKVNPSLAGSQGPALVVKKRGPRGKYNKRKKINIDVHTGKRRYTRRKLLRSERKSVENDSSSEKGDNEYESDDSNDSVPCLSDNGIWRPTDDLRLICNVMQTSNLKHVHIGVKFSCKFTLDDITERWRSLLYDEKVSRVAQTAINNLHPLVKHNILSAVLFSDKEEDLLKTVNEATVGNPDLKIFQKLLEENKEVFYKTRTPKCLFNHWLRLRELNLLNSQKERKAIERFETFAMQIDDEVLMSEPFDKAIMREMSIVKRNNVRKIKKLEKEVRSLQSIVDKIVLKDTVVKTESINSFATLKGGQVQYLMRSQEITFGRRTPHNFVDADIQLEGSADQVSRLQGKIALEENGQFNIHNFGRNNISVNAKPLRPFTKTLIDDQAIILIGKLSFIFEVNKPIIEYIQRVYNDRNRALQKPRRRDDPNQMPNSTLI